MKSTVKFSVSGEPGQSYTPFGAVMREPEVCELLRGTADPGFAVTGDGVVRCWNSAAEALFGIPAKNAVGRHCWDLMRGRTADGHPVCEPCCVVLQRAFEDQATPAFDVQVIASASPHWVNMSFSVVGSASRRYVIHLMRDIEPQKQLHEMTRHFLEQVSALSGSEIEQLLSPGASPHFDLTSHEHAVLNLLAEGNNTTEISRKLGIRGTTVRNHVEHILHKLSAHSRLEAVVRAIRERLV